MKKFFICLFILPCIFCLAACKNVQSEISSQTPVNSQNSGQEAVYPKNDEIGFATEISDVWTPTFQLCWNELSNLLNTPLVQYVDGNPMLADELNKKKFTKDDLNDKDYYISVSKQTLNNKRKIEKVIKEKFKEKSDILSLFQFPNVPDEQSNDWFIYSILIKNFPFISHFELLNPGYFNNNTEQQYKYFGYIRGSKLKDNELFLSITPLFYANDDDFALKIEDKSGKEEMILYLTNSDNSFDKIYSEIFEKQALSEEYKQKREEEVQKQYNQEQVRYKNYYKFPYLDINETLNYDKELAQKPLISKNNDTDGIFIITKTIQTIKFKMNEEGAKLKSEAAISAKSLSALDSVEIPNNYFFDRPFVIFLKEKNKEKPYFAAKIKDGKYLVKTK